ncbi:hypothetical protein SAMN06265222_106163 [Neorhodopirellula lusitana]|uniref:Uncharacterized protein n=1 Tax=Neorhodopirellula lusitana TaxID=445327 RepID=A0ABY1Q4E8_9BACT|nr:hypothetical protein [Neorhodopirellula lusitana]SMP59100.1 hypothetical protein SAMN06265222_106163 [Neorhodopirellula lusitana]
MEILIFCVVAWGIITLLGHATWVLISLLFSSSASGSTNQPAPARPLHTSSAADDERAGSAVLPRVAAPDPRQDLVAFQRMVAGLVSAGRVPDDEARVLNESAQQFVESLTAAGSPATTTPTPSVATVAELDASQAQLSPATENHAAVMPSSETGFLAESQPAAAPRRAFAEVVASFLAQHNIRWGELVAGMLIVVCSIGLVLSLWSTLTAAHRVVPAVVFMSADAAIFAAGLYTMRRWKLRHTSRAVLIVATLLVPLCVLAGLAAAGADANTVSLADPVTLAVIVVATVGCGWLLWQSSMALVGGGGAGALLLSVVASSLTLPLLPTAARWFGPAAGWVVIVPAFAVAFSMLWIDRRHSNPKGTLNSPRRRQQSIVTGRRVWKNQCLHLGITIASFASVIAYAAFLFREGGRPVWMQIAIATLPAWVSIALVFGDRAYRLGKTASDSVRNIATQRFVCSVLPVIAAGLVLAVIPAALPQTSWLWSHAVVTSVSLLALSIARRRTLPPLDGILPIGLAGMLTAPDWLAGRAWENVMLHRMIFGGEPMAVALACLLAGLIIMAGMHSIGRWRDAAGRFVPNASLSRWIGIWGILVAVQAIVLPYAPVAWWGRMPMAVIGACLAAVVIVSAVASLLKPSSVRRIVGAALSLIGAFSLTTLVGGLQLWQWDAIQSSQALWSLGGVMLGLAVTWILIRDGLSMRKLVGNSDGSDSNIQNFLTAAIVLFGVGTLWQYMSIVGGPLEGNRANPLMAFSLPTSSLWHLGGRAVGLSSLAAACYFGSRSSATEFRNHFLPVTGWIGSLFVAAIAAERLTDATTWQVVLATTIATGALMGIARLRPVLNTISSSILSTISTVAITAVIGVGSAVLLQSSWWEPIEAGLAADRFITLSVAAWWLVSAVGLAWSGSASKRVASAVLLPMTFALLASITATTSPIVWLQATALGALATLGLQWFRYKNALRQIGSLVSSNSLVDTNWNSDPAAALSLGWLRVVGLGSAACVILGIALGADWTIGTNRLADVSLPLGWATTLLALASLTFRRTWWSQLPLAVPVMSGHLAYGAWAMGWAGASETWAIVIACGLIGSLGSAFLVWRAAGWIRAGAQGQGHAVSTDILSIHSWHLMGQTVVLFVTSLVYAGRSRELSMGDWSIAASDFFGIVAMVGFVVGAISLLRMEARTKSPGIIPAVPSAALRVFGWLVVLGGCCLVMLYCHDNDLDHAMLSGVMAWTGACVILWRSDRAFASGVNTLHRADVEASALMLPMLGIAILFLLGAGDWQASIRLKTTISQSVLQCGIVLVVGASAWLRRSVADFNPERRQARVLWGSSQWLIVGGFALAAVTLTTVIATDRPVRWLAMSLTASFAAAVSAWLAPKLARAAFGVACERMTLGLAAMCTLVSIGFAVHGFDSAGTTSSLDAVWTRLSVLSLGMLAWGMFGLAEQSGSRDCAIVARRQNECVGLSLIAIFLLAIVGVSANHSGLFSLVAAMRLLITSTLAIGVLLLAIPKLLSSSFVQRWQAALRRGGLISATTAVAALVVMLGLEAVLRDPDFGVPGLPMPLIVVVGIVLGGLAFMAGLIAILSGPGFELPSRVALLRLSDRLRGWLLYGAQAIAAVTWLHLFLCRTGIAYLGLRQVWPYVVMVIAFTSVGLTQWAIRRQDEVLSAIMRRTAMFLPMIPVVGFWLSGTYATFLHDQDWTWTFYRGTTSYQGLLIVGAIYYGIMSTMWKNGFPRVATVVLANAGLWVMLTQSPGWGFLTHPQAWLIPPAACVLAIAHWQRQSLDPKLGSAIRYAATLTIYLASTADMLISEIGSSLWGPILLVGLSLIGMLAGVALRVKPFLYLGTTFAFLGVMSMVWHAGQAIDAVWPWWVFGITTGLVLLSILAGIEKHRDQLQRWSDRLATWD